MALRLSTLLHGPLSWNRYTSMLAVVRRMLAGEAVAQEESSLSKREWGELMDALGCA